MGPEIAQKIELEREKKRSRTVFRPAATFRAAGSVFVVVFCVFLVHGFFEKLREARRSDMQCRLAMPSFYEDVYEFDPELSRPEPLRPEEVFVDAEIPEEGAAVLEYKVQGGLGWEEGEEHGEKVVGMVLERGGELKEWKGDVCEKVWLGSWDFCEKEDFLSWGLSREFSEDVGICVRSVIPLPGGLRAGVDFEHLWKIVDVTPAMEPLRRAFRTQEQWSEFRMIFGDSYVYLRPEFLEDVLLFMEKRRRYRERELETAWCGGKDVEVESIIRKEDPSFRLPRPSRAWGPPPVPRGEAASRDLLFCLDRFSFFLLGFFLIYWEGIHFIWAVVITSWGFPLAPALLLPGSRRALLFMNRNFLVRRCGTYLVPTRSERFGWWTTSRRFVNSRRMRATASRSCPI